MEKKATMKAVVRDIKSKKEPYIAEVPMPTPIPNYVIVKVLASPVNPSDYYRSYGLFGPPPYEPYVCGNEGAGIVTDVGEGVPKDIIGKKISVWPEIIEISDKIGMWCEYARVPYSACVFLEDSQNCEEFCELFVNPLTLLSFVMIAKEMKCKTIIATAAMSALCKSLFKVCATEGIDVIGIIRKEEDLKTLLSLGAKYALNLVSPNFEKDLKEIAVKTDARVAFDAISGDMTVKLVNAMPKDSVVFVYGLLSETNPNLEPIMGQMKKENKKVEQFGVTGYKIIKDPEERKKALEYIQKDVKEGGKFFKIKVVKRFNLDEFKTAFDTYRTVASIGKVVITPNP